MNIKLEYTLIKMKRAIYLIFALCTAMIGYTIHGSLFWAIVDFFFSPIAWCKWLICHEVNMTIIHQTFDFFLK
jgi:hypothetical protein